MKSIVTLGPNDGQKLSMAGGNYRIVVSGKQTSGEFAVIEMTVPSGAGANPHAHENIVESFYVLEGEITFQSDAGSYIAQKGALVNIPKGGLVHCFKNKTDVPAKLLCTVMPAGLDDCFLEASDYLTKNIDDSAVTKKATLGAIAEKYGNKLYPENYFES
ncbi:Cupin domain-containing protein [Dyadobacter jejuensis]|uniref:Cupin domain-containing protein n=1 Tax=Dyadobacter jejuensis TaxID=1082580 RepID=A0A316AKE2_9BACT|nr:cupin domain-containing protein [Dyadobacter jejuensis]PWJ57838.1 Cupin domain-containing protein [Dyadobacter jejuensis]